MRLAVAMSVAALLAAATCAPPKQVGEASKKAIFICEGGIGFAVTVGTDQARIVTNSGVYDVEARTASFGRRYSSGDIAFAQDQERAVLIGADGGPFRNCVESRTAQR